MKTAVMCSYPHGLGLFCIICVGSIAGTPEAAGLTPVQAMEIVRGLKGLNLVGGDLVEVGA